MALRNQPYLPLYVQDYLTDEKLNECSASAQGVYIKIMCVMHKSSDYGVILLRQKDQQNESKIKNFASKLANQLPFSSDIIFNALEELVGEGVLCIDGDKLLQKRMVRDNELSLVRSFAGAKGAASARAKVRAKRPANAEYENETENASDNENKKEKKKEKKISSISEKEAMEIKSIVSHLNETLGSSYRETSSATREIILARLREGFTIQDFFAVHEKKFADWGNDPKMATYLRPITLYQKSKFESYLNQLSPRDVSRAETLVQQAIYKYGGAK